MLVVVALSVLLLVFVSDVYRREQFSDLYVNNLQGGVYLGTSQTVPSATATKVTLDTVIEEDGNVTIDTTNH